MSINSGYNSCKFETESGIAILFAATFYWINLSSASKRVYLVLDSWIIDVMCCLCFKMNQNLVGSCQYWLVLVAKMFSSSACAKKTVKSHPN